MTETREKAPNPESPPRLTQEQQDRIASVTRELMEKDKVIQGAAVTLVAARQLYHCALAGLHRHLQEKEVKESQLVEACLTKAMGDLAMREFRREDVLGKLQGVVLPFMAAELAAEKERERQEERAQEQAYEEGRRQQDLELPWPLYCPRPGDDSVRPLTLARDRGLVIAAPGDVLQFLLDQLSNKVQSSKYQSEGYKLTLCRLVDHDKPAQAFSKRDRASRTYFEIGTSQWVKLLNSRRLVATVLNRWIRYARRNRIDMLMVDDLSKVSEKPHREIPRVSHLMSSFRMLKSWTSEAGSFLVMGLPMPSEDYDPEAIEDELAPLSAYLDLRVVRVVERPESKQVPRCALYWRDGKESLLLETDIDARTFQ